MTIPGKQPARILHLSDLHFGWQFQPEKWDALKKKAKALAPDVVVITGDLVNTPWRWMLSRARLELAGLVTLLNSEGSAGAAPAVVAAAASGDPARAPCEVWVIPGNHDTRITGLLPVQWLYGIAAGAGALTLALYSLGELRPALPTWAHRIVDIGALFWLLIAVSALVLRLLVRSDLKRAWGEQHFLTEPRRSQRVPIGIVPFDSASEGVSWARGRVPNRALDFQSSMSTPDLVTWIAAVHHHPLPLPYDHRTERMMAMDNAGALLSQLAQAGVRLILHGHKHHQHFARIVIDPSDPKSAEVAVLSAGTPTNSRSPGAFWHGFNVITVHDDSHIQVEMYEAPPQGGSFRQKYLLDLAPVEEQDRRRHAEDRRKLQIYCDRMLCIADIDAYGDARFYREFRQVETERAAVTELAGPYIAGTTRGFVEAFRAESLSAWGPTINLKMLDASAPPNRIPAAVGFRDVGLQQGERPIDFVLQFFANNAFALNRWQYECMYPQRTPQESNERIRFSVRPDIAVRELTLHIRFPDTLPLPTRIDIRHGTPLGPPPADAADREITWRALPPQCLVRIESQRVVQARIPFPRLDSVYEINWEPHQNVYPDEGTPEEADIRLALELRKKFGRLAPDQSGPEALRTLVGNLELVARTILGAGPAQSYEIALFVFDEREKVLRFLLGNYAEGDPRRSGNYAFGVGLPGRAFKTAAVTTFRRPAYSPDERPWGYVFPDGRRVTDPNEVPEAAMLAIPMAPVHAPDWPYAVLQISTDHAGKMLKTANTASDSAVEQYCAAVRELTRDFAAMLTGS